MTNYEEMEWITEVTCAKNDILSSREKQNNPALILREVFELCQGDFDVNQMEQKYPEYYRILKHLCAEELETEEEIFSNSKELIRFFDKNKGEMRSADILLYYAVQNFIDMLKCKNMARYFDILLCSN